VSKTVIAGLMLWLCSVAPATAQVSIGIGIPGVYIGINLPVYPQLERVPGYPVYYAPGVNSNYFFYDGLYWAYQGDRWYSSSWYNGPWGLVDPGFVPVFLLRVPVRYYRQPPTYFHGWAANEPPHWDQHWGNDWSQRRKGWDKWDHKSYRPAPLPVYQRDYSRQNYPPVEKQRKMQGEKYRYRPKTKVVREQYQAQEWLPPKKSDQHDKRGDSKPGDSGSPHSKKGPKR